VCVCVCVCVFLLNWPHIYSQEGLSPCHLKKAKLLFFYARYPSSNTLKTYFPDVKVCVPVGCRTSHTYQVIFTF